VEKRNFFCIATFFLLDFRTSEIIMNIARGVMLPKVCGYPTKPGSGQQAFYIDYNISLATGFSSI
jgi:hypothetical protein